jgi:uncharacterized protein YukJ
VLVVDDQTDYRIAINVRSQIAPHEVVYYATDDFKHPMTTDLALLPTGFREVKSKAGGLALDYVRGNLFEPSAMLPLPIDGNGGNSLDAKLDAHIQHAMNVETAMIYAFGQKWGPEPQKKDQYFGFKPGNGIHDIHMNQANDPSHSGEDGVWQDGGLLIHFPDEDRWVATFLKFQSQGWHSDDATGHVVDGPSIPHPPVIGPTDQPPVAPHDAVVRIVAALVNPPADDVGKETVTLLNVSPGTVDLGGWALIDRNENRETVGGTLEPGAFRTIALTGTAQLGNKGGLITLVDAGGLKIDGVSYTAEQAQQGWTVVF